MKGTLVNVAAILAGSLAGMAFRSSIPEKYQKTVTHVLGITVGIIGIEMALKSSNMIVVIVSLAIGAVLGEALNLEGRLDRLGAWLARIISRKKSENQETEATSTIGKGFVTASLIYCIGAMAVIGSIQDGISGDARVLYAKSVLDGIMSIVLTSSMGVGVAFSSIAVLLYQGSITILAGVLEPFFSEQVISQLTATGGILIVGVSIIMLELIKIKLANLLPAIPVVIIISYYWT